MIAILDAARQMRLSEEAIGCVRPVASARAAVQALLDGGYQADALRLLARLLPRRYAVAWACQCGRRQPLNEHDLAGLALAEAWLREPAESQQGARSLAGSLDETLLLPASQTNRRGLVGKTGELAKTCESESLRQIAQAR